MSGSVHVVGSEPIEVRFEALATVATALRQHRAVVQHAASVITRLTTDATLDAASALDPWGAAAVAARAGNATLLILRIEQSSLALELGLFAAVAAYRGADRLEPRLAPFIRAATRLPGAATRAGAQLAADLARGDAPDLIAAMSTLLVTDPELLGVLLDAIATGGSPNAVLTDLVNPDPGFTSLERLAALASTVYRDRAPVVTRATGSTIDADGPPRRIVDLVRALHHRNENTDGGGIDVRSVWRTDSDGVRRRCVIVDITGTRDWNLARLDNPNVADTGTNLAAMAGRTTSYEQGVLQALADARVQPDEPVMLVGHSQGGLVAAQLVRHLEIAGRLGTSEPGSINVTHLLTAGAPIGLVALPDRVHVLSLENRGDPVPALDTADNHRSARHLTVRVDRGGTTPGSRHSLDEGYLPAAADVDDAAGSSAADVALRRWIDGAAEFLSGDDVDTQPYEVRRR